MSVTEVIGTLFKEIQDAINALLINVFTMQIVHTTMDIENPADSTPANGLRMVTSGQFTKYFIVAPRTGTITVGFVFGADSNLASNTANTKIWVGAVAGEGGGSYDATNSDTWDSEAIDHIGRIDRHTSISVNEGDNIVFWVELTGATDQTLLGAYIRYS